MFRQGTGSVFRRLFLLVLALVLLVYIVVTGFFINYVMAQRQIERSRQSGQVTGSASVIGQQLSAVDNVLAQLFRDVRLAKLSQGLYTDIYDRAVLILEVLASIQSTRDLNGIISDIVIHIPSEQIELSATGGFRRQAFDPAAHGTDDELTLRANQLELGISSPLRTSLEENYIPDFSVRILLSADYLNDYLNSFRNGREMGAFWVLQGPQENTLLFSTNIHQRDMVQRWSQAMATSTAADPVIQTLTCDSGEYQFTSTQVSGYNLSLVAYHSARTITWAFGMELIYLAAVILGLGGCFGLLLLWANRSVNQPIRKIMSAFEQLRSGDLSVRIFHPKNDEFDYLYDSFNAAAGRLEKQMESLKEQQTLLDRAEVMQLQSQINPHFLYNSFYNIKFLAQNEEYQQIETLVTALAKYYRFLNKQTRLALPLSEEAAHMDNYIEIQQMRFGDKITVDRQPLPEEAAGFQVPRLILQPIIENAYVYGLVTRLEGGLLRIRYGLEGSILTITVEDNGSALTLADIQRLRRQIQAFDTEAVNHALTNIHRRLILAYGDHCGVALSLSDLGGLKVTLTLDTGVNI